MNKDVALDTDGDRRGDRRMSGTRPDDRKLHEASVDVLCRWSFICDRSATATAWHPLQGYVPICDECARARHGSLSDGESFA